MRKSTEATEMAAAARAQVNHEAATEDVNRHDRHKRHLTCMKSELRNSKKTIIYKKKVHTMGKKETTHESEIESEIGKHNVAFRMSVKNFKPGAWTRMKKHTCPNAREK
jgi:hypothetical protein